MRKKVRFSVFGNANGRGDGDIRSWNVSPAVTIMPSAALQISITPLFAVNHNILQYVDTQAMGADARYIFGTIEQKTLGLTLRLNYSLTPNLTNLVYDPKAIDDALLEGFRQEERRDTSDPVRPDGWLSRYLWGFHFCSRHLWDAIQIAVRSDSELKHRAVLNYLVNYGPGFSPPSSMP